MSLRVGDIVKSKDGRFFEGYAVVYDTYDDFEEPGEVGVSIISDDGDDVGGFSFEEQERHLQFIKHSSLHYNFQSVMKLSSDFDDGVFDESFEGLL